MNIQNMQLSYDMPTSWKHYSSHSSTHHSYQLATSPVSLDLHFIIMQKRYQFIISKYVLLNR